MVAGVDIERTLTPKERVAVLLASLDRGIAAKVLLELDPDVMIEAAKTMQELGLVSGDDRDKALSECLGEIQELGTAVEGNQHTTNTLLIEAMGAQEASEIIGEIKDREGQTFVGLADMNADQLASILSREQVGIISLVLRSLPSQLAADVLNYLPTEVSRNTIVYMVTSEAPSDDIVRHVEQLLNAKVGPNKSGKRFTESDRLDLVSSILQHSKRAMEEEMLGAIAENSEGVANEIRDRLFTFEDVIRLSDSDMRKIMAEIDISVLAIALRSATGELKEKFTGNMSKRAAEGLLEEMEFAQKVKMTDIEAKQKEIVNIIRRLEGEGQITIATDADEYV